MAPSPVPSEVYDAMYYIKGAAAGGICCSITHGALTPVDVVKTRVQLDSAKVRQSQTTTKSNNNAYPSLSSIHFILLLKKNLG